jgi:GntR family transcriptional regulator
MEADSRSLQALRTIRLEKNSPIPVYAQIAQGLSAILRSGRLPAGAALPPERILCEAYAVSRMTLRQAMGLLEREGLIESQRGRGTFVAPPRLQKQHREFRSFTEEIRQRGGKPETKLLSHTVAPPSSEAMEFFKLTKKQEVYLVKRLRLDRGTPLAIEEVEIAQSLTPQLQRFDLGKNSLYQILEEQYGLQPASSVEEIWAEIASKEQRTLLRLPKNTAVLTIARKVFADHGQAIEFTKSVYRADLYRAVVHSFRGAKK